MTVFQLDNPEKEIFKARNSPVLGLVCITASKEIRYRTITRTRYLKLSETER